MNENSGQLLESTIRKITTAATSGKFEIIHADHINLFRTMAEMADMVYVYLNSDESILEYTGRPAVVPETQRAEVLEAIQYIDHVIYFKDAGPGYLISYMKPDFWCKGGDYDIETMQSTPIVRAYGGKVVCIPHKYGIHSSDILEKAIKRRPIDCNDLWVYYVYESNGAMIDRIVDIFTNEESAKELVNRNKIEFPNSQWGYEEMEVTE